MIQIDGFELKYTELNKIEDYSNWPMVYLLSDNRNIYVGESNRLPNRMKQHLDNEQRSKLTNGLAIYDEMANKSSTLHIESQLIEYLGAEGTFNILNGNGGERSHDFYQKELYESKLVPIWKDLLNRNFVSKELLEIENSDLFKYSPYKRLTDDQYDIVHSISGNILSYFSDYNEESSTSTFLVNGEAGTGKSIVGIYLLKYLSDKLTAIDRNHIKIGYVVPMSSFRSTMKTVAKNIDGLLAGMIIGPTDVVKDDYDILIVDEAHRLRQNKALMPGHIHAYKNINKKHFDDEDFHELDWILLKSKFQIMFYDSNQSVRPSDVPKKYFDDILEKNSTTEYKLESQLRVQGGQDYLQYVKNIIFDYPIMSKKTFDKYEFLLFENIEEMRKEIDNKNKVHGLSRMLAGYAWEWKTKNVDPCIKANEETHDIKIQGNYFRWNSKTIGWVLSDSAEDEVGSIHTIQGYDLNYAGVIIGPDLKYDRVNNKIIIDRDAYKDSKGKQQTSYYELDAYIRNIYSVLLTRAIKGTYVYVVDKNLREYLKERIDVYGRSNQENKQV